MELFLNTANPIIIIVYTLIVSAVIYFSRKVETTYSLILLMICIISLLIYHTVTLESLEKGSELISQCYHCIGVDLLLVLISFISYLWLDDIVAKKKNLKSYDDSLSWFWNKV